MVVSRRNLMSRFRALGRAGGIRRRRFAGHARPRLQRGVGRYHALSGTTATAKPPSTTSFGPSADLDNGHFGRREGQVSDQTRTAVDMVRLTCDE
jgi:hypothetical protein